MKIMKKKSNENCYFYSPEKSLYIAWACFRIVNMKKCVSRDAILPGTLLYFIDMKT